MPVNMAIQPHITAAQLAKLKTDILANVNTINGVQIKNMANDSDSAYAIAAWYNLTAAVAFTIWRKNVAVSEVSDSINGTDLAGLTSANHTRLQTVIMMGTLGVNPSLADRRQMFDDIFSGAGGTTTRAQLLVLWKTLATNAEKLFSTGTGSDASPATVDVNIQEDFFLDAADVQTARNL